LDLILFIIIRVINTNWNFSVAYNFAKSKVKISFEFFFICLKRFIFVDDIINVWMVLND
jgi:hypothetical protein